MREAAYPLGGLLSQKIIKLLRRIKVKKLFPFILYPKSPQI